MKRSMWFIAILLLGLIAGCNDDSTLPPNVLRYVNIDTYLNDDTLPQAAFDGTNYLVVYDEIVTDTNHDIIGAFVNTNGTVVSYINIDTSASDDRAPRVAFDGTNYLVVYQRTGTTNHDIIGVFVRTGGIVGTPFAIDGSANDDLAPAVAFNGTDYLVVYQRAVSGTNNDIIGAVVDPTGTVLAGSPFDIDTSVNNDLVPSAASNGTNFLVAYQRAVNGINDDIQGAVIDPTGPAVTLFGIDTSVSFDDLAPAVASDGVNYLVVYEEVASGSDRDIRGAQVDAAGTTVTLFGIDTAINFDDFAPSVAFDGTNYLVAYSETFTSTDHDIIGARVDPAGAVLSAGFTIDTSGFDDFNPAVVFGSTDYLVAYEEIFSSTNHDIFGALVKP
jgi:hypothetical protein